MPINTITEARDELLTHFTTKWNAQTPPIPLLLYDDKHRDLPDDAPYARITIKHNIFEQVTRRARSLRRSVAGGCRTRLRPWIRSTG